MTICLIQFIIFFLLPSNNVGIFIFKIENDTFQKWQKENFFELFFYFIFLYKACFTFGNFSVETYRAT